MFLTILLIFFLAYAVYRGYKRGLFLMLLSLLTTVISFFVAGTLAQAFGAIMNQIIPINLKEGATYSILNSDILKNLNLPLFAGISFLGVYVIINLLVRLLLLILHPAKHLLTLGVFGKILAAVLSFGISYFGLEILLTVASLLPISEIQTMLAGSALAKWMITETPGLANVLLDLFVTQIININPRG